MRLLRPPSVHRQVAAVLSTLAISNDLQRGFPSDADRFLEKAVFLRLRQLVERYPGYRMAGASGPPTIRA